MTDVVDLQGCEHCGKDFPIVQCTIMSRPIRFIRLPCGCYLDYERCIDCRPGLHIDQAIAAMISFFRALAE
jgi:hypothetical protein